MKKTLFRYFLKRYLRGLDQLQQTILLCYIRRDYGEQKYQYEKTLQEWRVRYFGIMKMLRRLAGPRDDILLDHLVHAYEIIFALTALLYRIHDHTAFEVCEREFKHITRALTHTLHQLHRGEFDPLPLSSAAEGFESIYQSTLRIMSNDPVVYLFYFQNVLALGDVLADIASLISGRPRDERQTLPLIQE